MTKDINYQGIDWEVGYDWEDDARTDMCISLVKVQRWPDVASSTAIFLEYAGRFALTVLPKSATSNLSTRGRGCLVRTILVHMGGYCGKIKYIV